MIQNKKILEKNIIPDYKEIIKNQNKIINTKEISLKEELPMCEIIKLTKLMLEDENCGLCRIIDEVNNNSSKEDLANLTNKDDLNTLVDYLNNINNSVNQSESNILNIIQKSDCSELADKNDIKLLQEYMVKIDNSTNEIKSDITNLQKYIYEINETKPVRNMNSKSIKSNHSSEYIQKDEMTNAMNFLVDKINKAFGDFEGFNKIKADFNLIFDL